MAGDAGSSKYSGALSAAQARRLSIRALGLDAPRPTGRVDRRHLRSVIDQLGLIQIDSVNVLARTQYLTMFSRVGPYDPALFDSMVYDDNEMFEYWGHVASIVATRFQPYLHWRMRADHDWKSLVRVEHEHPELVRALEREILENGPCSAGELDESEQRKGPWWGWGDTKRALELLFWRGRVGALRRGNFERVYCAPDAAVPPSVLDLPDPDPDVAQRALLLHAARMHGVGTAKDLADVWRQPIRPARRHLDDLVADGGLERVAVEGWRDDGYVVPGCTIPRKVDACALVSPFDQAMWERDRIERLYGFRYRIEIYVPKPRREYGYYVLPFLLGDTYVARVDLKADRAGRRLLVQSAHAEPDLADRGTDEFEVVERLGDELRTMATWLGLDDVVVVGPGDLSPALAAVLA